MSDAHNDPRDDWSQEALRLQLDYQMREDQKHNEPINRWRARLLGITEYERALARVREAAESWAENEGR